MDLRHSRRQCSRYGIVYLLARDRLPAGLGIDCVACISWLIGGMITGAQSAYAEGLGYPLFLRIVV